MTSRCQGLFPPTPFFEGKALGTRLSLGGSLSLLWLMKQQNKILSNNLCHAIFTLARCANSQLFKMRDSLTFCLFTLFIRRWCRNFYVFLLGILSYRGTQWEIWEKDLKNNNKTWTKVSEAILNILEDCWEKFICSSLPARLMDEFPASKVHLKPTTWLTGKFPSRQMSKHYWLVWVW